ncbi:MAG TPA: hypothetical protein VFD88_05845, partial [Clostridia bacterium]|nr:hypothetical protein [Clostridia bacterium]
RPPRIPREPPSSPAIWPDRVSLHGAACNRNGSNAGRDRTSPSRDVAMGRDLSIALLALEPRMRSAAAEPLAKP